MTSLSVEYTLLFNAVSDAISDLELLKAKLIQAQLLAEAEYISAESSTPGTVCHSS